MTTEAGVVNRDERQERQREVFLLMCMHAKRPNSVHSVRKPLTLLQQPLGAV